MSPDVGLPHYARLARRLARSASPRESCTPGPTLCATAAGYLSSPLPHQVTAALHSGNYSRVNLLLRNAPPLYLLADIPRVLEHLYSHVVPVDPEQSTSVLSSLAATLRTVQFPSTLEEAHNDLLAEAEMHLANSLRVLRRFPESSQHFATSAAHLLRGRHDPLDLAQHRFLEASYYLAIFELEKAKDLLRPALRVYKRYGHPLAAPTLVKAGLAELYQDKYKESRKLFGEASMLTLTDGALRSILLNVTVSYLWENRCDVAYRFFQKTLPSYATAPPPDFARSMWTFAEILAGLHRYEEAEPLLLRSLAAFRSLDLPYEHAQASVDLAHLRLATGRASEVPAILTSALTYLSDEGLLAEARAVVLFLIGSVHHLSLEHLRGAILFLRQRQYNPNLRLDALCLPAANP